MTRAAPLAWPAALASSLALHVAVLALIAASTASSPPRIKGEDQRALAISSVSVPAARADAAEARGDALAQLAGGGERTGVVTVPTGRAALVAPPSQTVAALRDVSVPQPAAAAAAARLDAVAAEERIAPAPLAAAPLAAAAPGVTPLAPTPRADARLAAQPPQHAALGAGAADGQRLAAAPTLAPDLTTARPDAVPLTPSPTALAPLAAATPPTEAATAQRPASTGLTAAAASPDRVTARDAAPDRLAAAQTDATRVARATPSPIIVTATLPAEPVLAAEAAGPQSPVAPVAPRGEAIAATRPPADRAERARPEGEAMAAAAPAGQAVGAVPAPGAILAPVPAVGGAVAAARPAGNRLPDAPGASARIEAAAGPSPVVAPAPVGAQPLAAGQGPREALTPARADGGGVLRPGRAPSLSLAAGGAPGLTLAPARATDAPLPAVAPTAAAARQANVAALAERMGGMVAWAANANAPLDEKSVAAIQSFMQPRDARQTAGYVGGVRDGLALELARFPCSRLQASFVPETGMLEVRGHVPLPSLEPMVREVLSRSIGTSIALGSNILVLPNPQCDILQGIEGLGLPQSRDQENDPLVIGREAQALVRRYEEGGDMPFDLSGADFDAYIYFDYFDANRTVQHIVPSALLRSNRIPANREFGVGAARAGRGGLLVRPPFGMNLAVMLASSHPLHDGNRPEREDAGAYMAWLHLRLTELRAAHPDFRGEWVYALVETVPRRR